MNINDITAQVRKGHRPRPGAPLSVGTKVKITSKKGSVWCEISGFRLMFNGETWLELRNTGLCNPNRVVQVAGTQLDIFDAPNPSGS